MGKTEVIDGYQLLWVADEPLATIDAGLQSGAFTGIGLNPFTGFVRDFSVVNSLASVPKAIAVPYGDRIAFDPAYLTQEGDIEMLLLSGFSGAVHFATDRLRILRVEVNKAMTFGALPALTLLYLQGVNKSTLPALVGKADCLQTLEINGGNIVQLEGIEAFATLKKVEISFCRPLKDITLLAKLPHLQELTIESCKKIENLPETLSHLKRLRILRVLDCGVLDDLKFLDDLKLHEFRCGRTRIKNRQSDAIKNIPVVYIG